MARLGRLLSLTPGHPQRPTVVTLIVLVLASPWVGIARFAVGDSDGGLMAIVGGAMLAVLLLIVLITGWFTGREMARLLADEAWARWRLDREEWIRHVERDWPRAQWADLGEAARLLARPLGMMLVGFALFGALEVGQPWSIPLAYRLPIFFLLAVGLAVWIAPVVAAHVRYALRKRAAVGEVVLGSQGVYVGGQYSYLAARGSRLAAARVEPGPPVVLHLEAHRPTRQGVERKVIRVPVPSGREGEAEALAERYRTEHGARLSS